MDWVVSVWEYLAKLMPQLNNGLWVSVQLIVPSALIGLAIGVVCGVLRVYGNNLVKAAMNFYVALFRGTPLVVQLFVWYIRPATSGHLFFAGRRVCFRFCHVQRSLSFRIYPGRAAFHPPGPAQGGPGPWLYSHAGRDQRNSAPGVPFAPCPVAATRSSISSSILHWPT